MFLLRSRLISIPKDLVERLRAVTSGTKLDAQELLSVLQQIYVTEEDGSKTLLVPYQDRVSKVPIHPTSKEKFDSDVPHFPPLPTAARTKPNIDRSFFNQLTAILFRVAIPKLRSKESLIVVSHSFFLVLRTVLSIMVARLDGVIVRDLVRADGKGFLRGLGLWFLLAIPSTYTNSMVCFYRSIAWQVRSCCPTAPALSI